MTEDPGHSALRFTRRAAFRTAAVALVALNVLAPLQGRADPKGPISAAFAACLGGQSTLAERLEQLNAAGWTVGSDSPQNSEIFGLAVASRFGHPIAGFVTDRELFEQTGRMQPVPPSFLRGEGEDGPVNIRLQPGMPVSVEAVVDFAQLTEHMGVFNLTSPVSPDVLSFLMLQGRDAGSSYAIYCSLGLSSAISTTEIVANIPGDVRQADLQRLPPNALFGDHTYAVSYATTAGLRGEVRYRDKAEFDQIDEFRSRHNVTAEISAIISLETQDVRLSDSTPSFRRIKP